MVSETKDRVAAEQQSGGAATGVPSATGAATGVPGASTGTPPTETKPDQPKLVPEEDLRRLQASLNRQADELRKQNDALAREIAARDQYIGASQQERQARDQQIETLRQEILSLKTTGLPEEEAQAERLRYERDRLLERNKALEQGYQAALKEQEAERTRLQQTEAQYKEAQARQAVIDLFLKGGTTPKGLKIEPHARYGLTQAELESCHSPLEMELLAAEKRQQYIDAREAAVSRKEAEVAAKERKDSGAHTFDRGEPTGGGSQIPKPGTPEFKEYHRKVRAGQISLRG